MKNGYYKIYHNEEETILFREEYYLNDKLHRDDGPAKTVYYDNGNIREEFFYLNGLFHREDGPSIIWYKNGNHEMLGCCYYLNDLLHREDGPAEIRYYENSNPRFIYRYYLNGLSHREDGPAIIGCNQNGDINFEYYFYKDIKVKVNSLKEYLEFVESEKLKEYFS